MELRERLSRLPEACFRGDGGIRFREIRSDDDLAVAVCELSLPPEQQELVNPAGFSIGRAYLFPADNVPYLICAADGEKEVPVGFITLRLTHHSDDPRSWSHWVTHPPRTNWSYFISQEYQGRGYGTLAARLAMALLLRAAPECPIELTTEQMNHRAQALYTRLGFEKAEEMDGDDFVFLYHGSV